MWVLVSGSTTPTLMSLCSRKRCPTRLRKRRARTLKARRTWPCGGMTLGTWSAAHRHCQNFTHAQQRPVLPHARGSRGVASSGHALMGRKPDLTPEEAEDVRRLYYDRTAKWTVAALARSFGVQPTAIRADNNRQQEQTNRMWEREENNRNQVLHSNGIGNYDNNRPCAGIAAPYGRCN
jgi:hypothetical protein